jgi:hypothetical protein
VKEKYVGMFWGLVLVLVGAWFLATGRTNLTINDPYLGMAFTGGLSLLFFASYFVSGTKHWGWLFPACIFAGTALVILLSQIQGIGGGVMAAPVLVAVGVPFLVAYLQSPKDRSWALIPLYVMAALTLIVSFVDTIQGEFIGTLVLLMVALPFLVVYLRNRQRKWPLIPFGVLFVISLIPALTALVNENSIGVVMMLLMAAPFVVVYFLNQRNWWAIIPAGVFVSIALVVLLTLTVLAGRNDQQLLMEQVTGGVLFLCFGLTFLGVWLRRATAPTAWAIYPAVVLGLLALVTFIGGQKGLTYAGPLAVIVGGILLIYNSNRRKLV